MISNSSPISEGVDEVMRQLLMNPFHNIASGDSVPELLNAYIECPMRSKIKYELDKKTGHVYVNRMLHSSVHYPSNYGFIPQTYCRDHDPLDILVLSQEPVAPGVIMKAKPIGELSMFDGGKEDVKVIAVHVNDPLFKGYTDISQLPPHLLREMHHFFSIYKALEDGVSPDVGDFNGRIDAHKMIKESISAYKKYREKLLKFEYPDF